MLRSSFGDIEASYARPEGRVHGIVTVLLQAYGIVQRNDGLAARAKAWLGTRSTMTFW
jgi:hypothetical protein